MTIKKQSRERAQLEGPQVRPLEKNIPIKEDPHV